MKKICVLGLVVVWMLAVTASADTIWKLTFDNAPLGDAPATYTPGAGEISPAGVVWTRESSETGTDIVSTPGGKGIQVAGGSWSSQAAGYYSVATGGSWNIAPGQGITMETVAKFDPWSSTNGGGTVMQYGWQSYPLVTIDTLGNGTTDKTAKLHFNVSGWAGAPIPANEAIDTAALTLVDGNFHHIAAVLNNALNGDTSYIQLYVDGVSQGQVTWTSPGLSLAFNGSQMAIGSNYNHWPLGMSGVIDAAAGSNAALAPGSFVIPEPATMLILGLGSLLVFRRK